MLVWSFLWNANYKFADLRWIDPCLSGLKLGGTPPFERVKVRGRDLTSPRLIIVVGIRKNIKSKKVAFTEQRTYFKGNWNLK